MCTQQAFSRLPRGARAPVVVLVVLIWVGTILAPAAAYQRPGETALVSATPAGASPSGPSTIARMSDDGPYTVFQSSANDLVPGDTNGATDIFLRDMAAGTVERISVAADGTEADGASIVPAISGDGRVVAFSSAATNLIPGDSNGFLDVFVKELETGETELVSVSSDGTQVEIWAEFPFRQRRGSAVAARRDGPVGAQRPPLPVDGDRRARGQRAPAVGRHRRGRRLAGLDGLTGAKRVRPGSDEQFGIVRGERAVRVGLPDPRMQGVEGRSGMAAAVADGQARNERPMSPASTGSLNGCSAR